MHGDSLEQVTRDYFRGKCVEAWFAETMSRDPSCSMVLIVSKDWHHSDMRDYRTGETFEIKEDSKATTTGNVMFELRASNTEPGWGLRYDGRTTYLVFVDTERSRILCVHAKPFIGYVKDIIGAENLIQDFKVVRKHMPDRWRLAGVKNNMEGKVILVPKTEVARAGFVRADFSVAKFGIPFKDFETMFFRRLNEVKTEDAKHVRAHEMVDLFCRKTYANWLKKNGGADPMKSEPKKEPEANPVVVQSEPEPEPKKDFKDAFVHLHVHSSFSLLDGVPNPIEIATRVKELGQPAIAITDHGYMFGNYKMFQACRQVGIRDLQGFEAYYNDDIADRSKRFQYHLTLIAMNEKGWDNLIRLNSLAGKDGFFYKPRIDQNLLRRHHEGLIVLSGCYKSPVAYHLSEEARDPDLAKKNMTMLKEILGDRFYCEVMSINWKESDSVMPELIQMAKDMGVRTVVTNDCHYLKKEDAETQKVMLKMNTKNDAFTFDSTDLYVKTRAEIVREYVTPEMADTTLEIMDRVTLDLGKIFTGDHVFPSFDITKSGDYQRFLEYEKGAKDAGNK